MNTTTRILDDLRPTTEPLDPHWSAETLAAIMAQPVLRDGKGRTRTGRSRRRSAWLAAAAAVVGVIAVPTVMTSGGASAHAELLQLAKVAADADGPAISPGTYLHVKTESLQENSRIFSDGRRLDTDREAWVRWDGATWAVDTRPSAGWTEYHRFAAPGEASFGSPTPAFISALPDSVAELRTYLDDTVSGSNSHNEALFVAISDLAGSRMLDPKTFAVALEVLADVDGVETQDVVVDGRAAVEVRYASNFGMGFLGRESFTVERKTAQVLRVADSDPSGTYQSQTRLIEVVDEVPTSVLSKHRQYGNGSRICADGREARGTADPQDTCS